MKELKRQLSVTNKKKFHLAGVIPLFGKNLDFEMPYEDFFLPIGANYTLLERAIYECACAGCKTIWIVSSKEVQPLLRHRIGDWVQDPVWMDKGGDKNYYKNKDKVKEIPIFYVPIHPKDRHKKNLGWSALYGIHRANTISKDLSRWTRPGMYYVAFPYGVYNPEILKDYRERLSSEELFYLKYDNKTIRDGEYLGFSITNEEYEKYRESFLDKKTEIWKPTTKKFSLLTIKNTAGKIEKNRIPSDIYEEMGLDSVFSCGTMRDESAADLPWYYNISSWKTYVEFMSSEHIKNIFRPKELVRYREFNPIGFEEKDDF